MIHVRLIAVISVIFFLSGPVFAQQIGLNSEIHAGSSVPFELRSGFLIMVEGRIGSLGPLKFIVDTGSSVTIVSQRVADRLPLVRQRATLLRTVEGAKVKIESAVFPEVRFGPLKILNKRMSVADLTKFSEFAADADAVVGTDLLSLCEALEIDYRAQSITFVPSRSTRDSGAPTKVFVTTGNLDGRHIHLLVDTGMQGVVLFRDRVRVHIGRWQQSESALAMIGSTAMEQVRLASLWLGSVRIDAPVFIASGRHDMIPEDIDGVLGPLALKASRISFDFQEMALRFQ